MARKELEIEYSSNSGNGNGKEPDDDEFTRAEEEQAWYAELAKHGFDSYESMSNAANSERIWMLFQAWNQEREQRQKPDTALGAIFVTSLISRDHELL
jgi:hypothetical protein